MRAPGLQAVHSRDNLGIQEVRSPPCVIVVCRITPSGAASWALPLWILNLPGRLLATLFARPAQSCKCGAGRFPECVRSLSWIDVVLKSAATAQQGGEE